MFRCFYFAVWWKCRGNALLSIDFGASIHYDLLIMDDNVSEDFLVQVRELGVVVEAVNVEGA